MKKSQFIFLLLSCIFVSNVILAEIIGVKIFSLEATVGMTPIDVSLWGHKIELTYTAGVLIWPIVFVLTDIVNDYFGKKGVKTMTYISVGIILYMYVVVWCAIRLSPVEWWQSIYADQGLADYNLAYKLVLGQGNNIIIGSLVAFVIGQFVDMAVFQNIKKKSNNGGIWFRATVSTLVSQLIDSFVVLYIAFYLGQNWPLSQVMHVALNNYIYKGIVAILMIPILLLVHRGIEAYLGKEEADKLRKVAIDND